MYVGPSKPASKNTTTTTSDTTEHKLIEKTTKVSSKQNSKLHKSSKSQKQQKNSSEKTTFSNVYTPSLPTSGKQSNTLDQFVTPVFDIIQDVIKARNSEPVNQLELDDIRTSISLKIQNSLDNPCFTRLNLYSINCQSDLDARYSDDTPRSVVMDQLGNNSNMVNLEFWRLVLVRGSKPERSKKSNGEQSHSKEIIMETKAVARNNLKLMIMRNFLGFSPCERLMKEKRENNCEITLFTKQSSNFHEPMTAVPLIEPYYTQKRPIPKFYLSESYSLQLEVFQKQGVDSLISLRSAQFSESRLETFRNTELNRFPRFSESSNQSSQISDDGLIQDHEHLPSNCPICIESNHLDVNRTHLSSISTDDEISREMIPFFTSTPAAKRGKVVDDSEILMVPEMMTKTRKTPSPKNTVNDRCDNDDCPNYQFETIQKAQGFEKSSKHASFQDTGFISETSEPSKMSNPPNTSDFAKTSYTPNTTSSQLTQTSSQHTNFSSITSSFSNPSTFYNSSSSIQNNSSSFNNPFTIENSTNFNSQKNPDTFNDDASFQNFNNKESSIHNFKSIKPLRPSPLQMIYNNVPKSEIRKVTPKKSSISAELELVMTNGIVFNKNTGLPTRSSPIQVPEVQFDLYSESEMVKSTGSIQAESTQAEPAQLETKQPESKQLESNSTQNPTVLNQKHSPTSTSSNTFKPAVPVLFKPRGPLLTNFIESLLAGRLECVQTYKGYYANLSCTGENTTRHAKLAFNVKVFKTDDDQFSPFTGKILPVDRSNKHRYSSRQRTHSTSSKFETVCKQIDDHQSSKSTRFARHNSESGQSSHRPAKDSRYRQIKCPVGTIQLLIKDSGRQVDDGNSKSGSVKFDRITKLERNTDKVVKIFSVTYDLRDMPVSHKTFIRQSYINKKSRRIQDLIHLRFETNSTGHIFLAPVQVVFSTFYNNDVRDSEASSLVKTNFKEEANAVESVVSANSVDKELNQKIERPAPVYTPKRQERELRKFHVKRSYVRPAPVSNLASDESCINYWHSSKSE